MVKTCFPQFLLAAPLKLYWFCRWFSWTWFTLVFRSFYLRLHWSSLHNFLFTATLLRFPQFLLAAPLKRYKPIIAFYGIAMFSAVFTCGSIEAGIGILGGIGPGVFRSFYLRLHWSQMASCIHRILKVVFRSFYLRLHWSTLANGDDKRCIEFSAGFTCGSIEARSI